MILVADESVDRPIIERLRLDGHTIHSIAELAPSIADEEVLELARRAAAPLLTADKDFGELVYRRHQISAGVLLIRLAGLSPAAKAQIVATMVRQHEVEMAGAFVVITALTIRIRPNSS